MVGYSRNTSIMKNIKYPILLVTAYLIFYTISPQIGIPERLTIAMFLVSPFLVIGLVLWVLIKGEASDKTWSEGYFYEDKPKRVGGGE